MLDAGAISGKYWLVTIVVTVASLGDLAYALIGLAGGKPKPREPKS